MKVAFTTSGDDLSAHLDSRFGRAPAFLILDLDTQSMEVVPNQQNLKAVQGAGIQAAQTLIQAGVTAVVTGHCGPKAHRVLRAAKVSIHHCAAATVQDALTAYQANALPAATAPNAEGHWS